MPEPGSHDEAEELRASRARLVHAADADRRRLERELHDGVQQRLVALAVELQLAEPAEGVLEEMRRGVDGAIEDARRLAERMYAPLELGGLPVALRAAAASAGTAATVDVDAGPSYPDVVARTVYLCWLEAVDAAAGGEPTIRVRGENGTVGFELSAVEAARPGLERLRDRVEALGGRLELDASPSGGLRASGSLPL